MKLSLFILAILFSIKIFSQSYIPIFTNDKEWTVRYRDSVRIAKILGDTFANGKTYKVFTILSNNGLGQTILAHSYVREDTTTRKCWVLNKNKISERILYDFNLIPSDTISFKNIYVPNPPQEYYTLDSICSQNCNKVFCEFLYSKNVVVKSGLKIYYFQGSSFAPSFQYIEGVGSIFAPVYLDESIGCGGNWGGCVNSSVDLICCKKGTEILYFKECYLDCDSPKKFVNGIKNNLKQPLSFKAQPNPATNEVNITNPTNAIVVIRIYNYSCELVLESELEPFQTKKLTTSNLSKGIYFIESLNFETQKIIIR